MGVLPAASLVGDGLAEVGSMGEGVREQAVMINNKSSMNRKRRIFMVHSFCFNSSILH